MNSERTAKIECPACGQHYSIPVQESAVTVTCSNCDAAFEVEFLEDVAPDAAQCAQHEHANTTAQSAPNQAVKPRTVIPSQGSTPWSPPNISAIGARFHAPNTSAWAMLYDVRIFLRWLKDGALIRTVTAASMKVGAVICALGCLYLWAESLKLFSFVEGAMGTIGVLLWLIFFPYSCYLAISASWFRADDIRKLPGGQFAISPILSILVNLHGEVIFILCAAWSLPAALLVWGGSLSAIGSPVDFNPGDGLLAALGIFILMWAIGYTIYLITRWIQEIIFVFPSMAHNLDLIEQHTKEKM